MERAGVPLEDPVGGPHISQMRCNRCVVIKVDIQQRRASLYERPKTAYLCGSETRELCGGKVRFQMP